MTTTVRIANPMALYCRNWFSKCMYLYNLQFVVYLLQNQEYVRSQHSQIFPDIAIAQIIPAVLERSWQVGCLQALEEFEATIKIKN